MKQQQLPTITALKRWASVFYNLNTDHDLAVLLELNSMGLDLLCHFKEYNEFKIPKKVGGFRLIEDPNESLKKVLQKLNKHLQACHYFQKTQAAYGFVVVPVHDSDPRNILTNAHRHRNKSWLLNADFSDFFHAIDEGMVRAVFRNLPFGFSEALTDALVRLTTYKGRLPMGSPTSPVLSNLASRGLDEDLLFMANSQQWVYTRYADDLSFSSNQPFTTHHLQEIRNIAAIHNYSFNENKVHIYSPSVEKHITGLKVTDKVSLPDDFFGKLMTEIQKLEHAVELKYRVGQQESEWLDKFKQQIAGHLQFAKFVEGAETNTFKAAQKAYQKAIVGPNQFDSASWLDFNYLF